MFFLFTKQFIKLLFPTLLLPSIRNSGLLLSGYWLTLTATFDRSDKTESVCFKRAFQSVLTYGERQSYEVIEKHVVYHVININSRIDQKNRARLLKFRYSRK